MLSFRLSSALMDNEVIAGLSLYSDRAAAFDDTALRIGLLLACTVPKPGISCDLQV